VSLKLKDIPEENTPELLHRSDIVIRTRYTLSILRKAKKVIAYTYKEESWGGRN
jgi:hypothetical protein